MKKLIKAMLFGAVGAVSACAEYPNRVEAAYIPSIVYSGATCAEITRERGVLAQYVRNIAQKQKRASITDTASVTTSLIIFWPAIAALPFTKDQSTHLAVARGHYDALIKASQAKGCPAAAPAYLQRQQTASWKRYPGDFPPL